MVHDAADGQRLLQSGLERDRVPGGDPAAAVLQHQADDAVNYGAIGAVIGHEISHGFDDQGRKFDGDGNLRDWWTEKDNASLKSARTSWPRSTTAMKSIDGLTVNGELTSGENIGDLGGLGIAYKAYKMSLDGSRSPGHRRLYRRSAVFPRLGTGLAWKDA